MCIIHQYRRLGRSRYIHRCVSYHLPTYIEKKETHTLTPPPPIKLTHRRPSSASRATLCRRSTRASAAPTSSPPATAASSRCGGAQHSTIRTVSTHAAPGDGFAPTQQHSQYTHTQAQTQQPHDYIYPPSPTKKHDRRSSRATARARSSRAISTTGSAPPRWPTSLASSTSLSRSCRYVNKSFGSVLLPLLPPPGWGVCFVVVGSALPPSSSRSCRYDVGLLLSFFLGGWRYQSVFYWRRWSF